MYKIWTILTLGVEKNEPAVPILNWQVVQLRSSWGVLILIGGGYAIAQASDDSGPFEISSTKAII